MHDFVLEDHEDRLGPVEQRVAGAIDVAVRQRIDHALVRLLRELPYHAAARPALAVARGIRRGRPVCRRVDAAREQPFEHRIDAGPAERGLHQRVEAERGHVPLVEDERMSKGDGLAVVRVLVLQEIEQEMGSLAIAAVPRGETVPIDRAL